MKIVKKLRLASGIFLFLGVYAYAQAQFNPQAQSNSQVQTSLPEQASAQKPPTADDMVQKMKTDLNLTQQQADAIKPIIEQNMAKQKELIETLKQRGADKDTIRSQMEQLNQGRDQQLSKILSQDQMNKLNGIKTAKHNKEGKKHKRRRPGQLD